MQKCRRPNPIIPKELQQPATTCVQIAIETSSLIVSSVNTGVHVSGTIQAILFQAVGYLWNALETMLLIASSDAAQSRLSPIVTREHLFEAINSALSMLKTYEDTIPLARTAVIKSESVLRRAASSPPSREGVTKPVASTDGVAVNEKPLGTDIDWLQNGATTFNHAFEMSTEPALLFTEAPFSPSDFDYWLHDATFGRSSRLGPATQLDTELFPTAADSLSPGSGHSGEGARLRWLDHPSLSFPRI